MSEIFKAREGEPEQEDIGPEGVRVSLPGEIGRYVKIGVAKYSIPVPPERRPKPILPQEDEWPLGTIQPGPLDDCQFRHASFLGGHTDPGGLGLEPHQLRRVLRGDY